tara:strand:- start:151 stop:546 length:396 start_codon:yes stop_codon:yes gene_type:complete
LHFYSGRLTILRWIIIFSPIAITLILGGLMWVFLGGDGLGLPFLVAILCNGGYSFLMFADAKGWMELPGKVRTEEEMEQTRQRFKELKESGEWERISQERINFSKRFLYGVLVFILSIICYVIYWFLDDSY